MPLAPALAPLTTDAPPPHPNQKLTYWPMVLIEGSRGNVSEPKTSVKYLMTIIMQATSNANANKRLSGGT